MKKKTPQILILVGPPGSGKTTFAEQYLNAHPHWIRVSRDDFRAMQFQCKTTDHRTEQMISVAVDACIEALLLKKSNVLIDATHCKKEYINHYIRRFNHLADIHFKVFEVPLQELTLRCAAREKKTGRHIPAEVLQKFVDQYEQLKQVFDFAPVKCIARRFNHTLPVLDKPSCFLFDLDGTLADAHGRNMFSPTAEDVMNDIPIRPVIEVLRAIDKQHQVIFVSGRERTHYAVTRDWIIKHIFCNEARELTLLMRPEGDYRRDSVIKKEFLKNDILPNYAVLGAFDDRLQVVRECWNAEGIFCFNVNQFLEEF